MKIFKFTNLRNCIRDIRNYTTLLSAIRKHKGTADWLRFDLRVDWVGRIYTVFNPLPADKGDTEDVLQIKLGERMIPCHKYMDSIGLSEIVAVSGEKIPDSDAYLIVYYPMFKYITTWTIFINVIILALLALFHMYIINGISWLTSLTTSLI
jgi:hypothetical protein